MPEFWSNLGSIIWYTLTIIIFISYLMVLFSIISDIFRDRNLAGGWKALWIFFLIFVPIVTALVYLIARGRGMGERQAAAVQQYKTAQDDYIKEVAGTSPADQIAQAKSLLDAGTITQAEFDALKAKALA